jgi:hypothetical protein
MLSASNVHPEATFARVALRAFSVFCHKSGGDVELQGYMYKAVIMRLLRREGVDQITGCVHYGGDAWLPKLSFSLQVAWSLTLLIAVSVGLCYATDSDAVDQSSSWFDRVDRTQEEQPHWMTPLVTVTPRLEEEWRSDFTLASGPSGLHIDNYGAGKGLELIPFENIETIIGVPGYIIRNRPRTRDFGDWPFFLIKYRLLSANEEHGNYIFTVFGAVSAPVGSRPASVGEYLFTPTLAFGKGWGGREQGIDIQSTASAVIPEAGFDRLGIPFVWNTAFQAHLLRFLWPELEVGWTRFNGGAHSSEDEVDLTPGVIFGRFQLYNRLRFAAGVGYRVGVGPTRTFNNALVVSVRTPF